MSRGEPSTKLFEEALRELVQLLRRTPATARQIAEAFTCTRSTAHKRLNELERRRLVTLSLVREGMTGPKSILYTIKQERA